MDNIKLGKFLAQIRQEKGLTQEELAELLNIDKRKISRWENGISTPEFDLLIKLTEILNVTLYEISICQRVKDPTLLEKTKNKLKTLKDLKRLEMKKKIMIIIAIIFGIILGLCAVFTIDNYGTVEIYSLQSLDDNFKIEGSYIKAKDYNAFIVTRLGYEKDNDKLNIDIYDIEFIVLDSVHSVFNYSPQGKKTNQKTVNLSVIINEISFIKERIDYILSHNDDLLFQILYKNEQFENQTISFKFKLIKKFNN